MKHNLPPLTQDLLEALVASAGLWLARLLAVLTSPRAANRKRTLHRLVQLGERWIEQLLFVIAAHRLGKRRRRKHRIIARPGFRITTGNNRLLWKSARLRLRNASLSERVQHLLHALANPARYIAHFTKRLARGICFHRLVARAPAAVALSGDAHCAATFADSS